MTIIHYGQLNHVLRTRDLVKKNDAKLAKLGESADNDRFRDQGFTRPKVKNPLRFLCDVFLTLISVGLLFAVQFDLNCTCNCILHSYLSLSQYVYIYIRIYMYLCLCVCVYIMLLFIWRYMMCSPFLFFKFNRQLWYFFQTYLYESIFFLASWYFGVWLLLFVFIYWEI